MARLEEQFDGDYTLAVHLAPPLLSQRNPDTRRYPKREFGPWIFTAFRYLAKLKVLRGTALDVFGYSGHRKRERELIREYEELVEQLSAGLSVDNHGTAVKLASLPEQVRGFDVVKEESLEKVAAQREQLLAEFRAEPAPASMLAGA